MAFNLRTVLGATLPALARGEFGTAIGTVGSLLTAPRGGGFANGTVPVALPGGGGIEPVAGAGAVAVLAGAAGLIRALLAKAAQFLGRRVSKASALDLIRKFGPSAAAGALGWTVAETIQFWMATGGQARRFRRRGITGRQLSAATSTFRRMESFRRRALAAVRGIGGGGGGGGRRRAAGGHKAGCACVVCRRR